MWHVSSRSSVATLRTAIHLLLTYCSRVAVEQSRYYRRNDVTTMPNSHFSRCISTKCEMNAALLLPNLRVQRRIKVDSICVVVILELQNVGF